MFMQTVCGVCGGAYLGGSSSDGGHPFVVTGKVVEVFGNWSIDAYLIGGVR